MNKPRLTINLLHAKAWQQGYTAGRAGNDQASPPYVVGSFTEPLIRHWKDGQTVGLRVWREQRRIDPRVREQLARDFLRYIPPGGGAS